MSTTTSPAIPYVRPWGSGYQVRVRPFPEETCPTISSAMSRVGELLELRAAGVRTVAPAADRQMLLGGAGEKWLRGLEKKGGKRGPLGPDGLKHYTYASRPWRETDPKKGAALDAAGVPFAARPFAALVAFELEDWLEDRSAVALTSARNERQTLIGIAKVARKRGVHVDPAIFELDPIVVGAPRRAKALSVFELDWFIDAVRVDAKVLVALRGSLGLRGRTIFNMLDTMVNLREQQLELPAAIMKSKRDTIIPLDEHEAELLHRALLERPAGVRHVFSLASGGRWTQSQFYDHVMAPGRQLAAARWREEFGDQVTPFDEFDGRGLRRTATTLMRKAGMSPETIALRLGHNDGGALVLSTYSDAGDIESVRRELGRVGSVRKAAA